MKRREFLQTAAFASVASAADTKKLTNWSGNIIYSTQEVQHLSSLAQVQNVVRSLGQLKVLGTRHCFNDIADSAHALITLDGLQNIDIDTAAKTVTVSPMIKYGQLGPKLDEKGLALHNLASLPHISVAGACTTATHGSGEKNANLATEVEALDLVTASGDIVHLERGSPEFNGAVVGLGALGVVTTVKLRAQPTYQVKQYVYQNMPLLQVQDHFDEIQRAGYSVSLFTDWTHESVNEVWVKARTDAAQPFTAPEEWFGAKLAHRNLHPIATLSAENCTEQLGVPGPWYDRLPHFRMGFTPSAGAELQTEYLVARQHAIEAILTVQKLHERVSPHLFITEIRTIAADDLWMSTAYKRDSIAIHFTWKPEWPAVRQLLPVIERELAPFQPRPHWGKLFTLEAATLRQRYEKFDDFVALAKRFDPKGKFRNAFLNRTIFS